MAEAGRPLAGGIALLIRQGGGSLLAFASLLLVTAWIGPASYGAFAAAAAVVTVAGVLAHGGLVQRLVRQSEADDQVVGQALSTVLIQGAVVLGVAAAVVPWVLPDAVAEGRGPAWAMLAVQALVVTAQAPLAVLERRLAYRTIAVVEGLAQVTGVGVALLLAWQGGAWGGVWAPAWGWMAQQALTGAAWWWCAGRSVTWRRPAWAALWRDQAAMTCSLATSQGRVAVVPLLAAHLLTAAEVGALGLVQRLVEAISLPRIVIWRVGTAALARRTAATIPALVGAGSLLAVVSTALILAAFLLVALPWLSGWLGDRWAPVAQAFPVFAAGSIIGAAVTLSSAAMHQAGRSWEVVGYHLALILLVVLGVVLLVPRWGWTGVLVAEAIAALGHGLIVWRAHRHYGDLELLPVVPALVAGILLLTVPTIGMVAALPALLLLVLPPSWRRLRRAVAEVR